MNFDDLKEDFKSKKAPLVEVELKECVNTIISNKIDFSKYNFNNWLQIKNNSALNKIHSKGGAIWLNCSGDICYRFAENGIVTKVAHAKANIVFSNYLKTDIKLISGTKDYEADIKAIHLMMVENEGVFSNLCQHLVIPKILSRELFVL